MGSSGPAVLEGPSDASAGAAAPRVAATRTYQGVQSWLLGHWELLPLVGFALALTLVYLWSAPAFGLPFDDSYISLQFARNLARHGFITFDGETASAGATSLVHVAILAVPIKLGVEPVRASIAVGVILHVSLVPVVYWLAWRIFNDRLVSALSAASVAVMGYLAFDALNGMETTLFLVVSTAAAGSFLGAKDERGFLVAGLLVALAVLTRPEGVLLLGAMGLYYVVDPRRGEPIASTARRLALLGGPSAIALIGLASFYWVTTDSIAPGTATAKLLFFREFDQGLQTKFNWAQGGVANFLAPLLPWLALSAFAVRRREALLFAFFWVAFIVLYYALFPGGLTHYWYRYQHVFLPAIAVFGSAGVVSLLRGRRWRAWDVVSAAVVGSVLLGAVAFQYESFRDNYAYDVNLNETRQVGMARYLQDVVPPDGTIATHDIGAIGFYSEREIIDLVGLVNPDVVEFHDGRRLRAYLDEVQPSYVVVFQSWERQFLRLGLQEDQQLFEEVRVFPGGRAGPFIVYKTHY